MLSKSGKTRRVELILRYVAIYDLHKSAVATVGIQVECLRFNGRVLQDSPFKIILRCFGEGWVPLVRSNWLNRFGAILGLLGTGNAGQPIQK